MRKNVLFILACLLTLTVLPCRSQDNTSLYLMVINKEASDTTFFKVSDYPVVKTLTDAPEFSVSLSETTTVYFPIKDCYFKISRLEDSSVEPITDSIDEPVVEKPILSGGRAIFRGLHPGSFVTVFGVDGSQIFRVKADASGCAIVDYGTLPSGKVYILRSESTSIKIIK